jgi:uncharacterized protein (DUF1697 family)
MADENEKITLRDVQEIRRCAEALQVENVKRYGESGILVLRERSERTLAIADKLERKLSV